MTNIARSRLRVPKVKAVQRHRLDDLVSQAWSHRVTLILAPAGSGKTTAMAEFANRAAGRVAWITCGATDDSAESFIAYLNAALREVAPQLTANWRTVDDALEGLVALTAPTTLAIDDVHTLSGSAAETALGVLVTDAPDLVHFVLAGRREPGFDLSAIRMMGQLHTVDSDQLRFRSWEAEQLFRDLYETWLRPDDIARLSRRVEGWAAGLQMFHLAARGLSSPEQRRLIDRLNGRARIVREYLAANVLEPISPELRTFLIDTCVLGLVTPALANELRGEVDAEQHLRELANSQLFTVAIDDDTYRYHEVLRAQLELLLIERDGEELASHRYRTAGALLERDRFHYDALRCFARAGDWDAVQRLANRSSDQSQNSAMAWITDLPHSIVADDPWLLLARARAERLAGRWSQAVVSFLAAEAKGLGAEFVDQCRVERTELNAWIDPLAQAPHNWVARTRAGSRREPLIAANELDAQGGVEAIVAASALRLLGGDVRGATATAERAINTDNISPYGLGAALAVVAVARLISGTSGGERALDDAEMHAERTSFGWIARIVRASLALTKRPQGVDEATRVREQCLADGDPWGAALGSFLGGLGAAHRGEPANDLLREAARRFRALDASALEAACMVALAASGHVDAADATAAARATGIEQLVPVLYGFIAPRRTEDFGSTAAAHAAVGEGSAAPLLAVQCLGRFSISVEGRDLSLEGLRPKARSLLKMLAIHTDTAVHREAIVDGLWPDGDAASGIHNLQVAISAIRKLLSAAGVPDDLGVQRQGEAYRLVLSTRDSSDLAQFLEWSATAKLSATRNDHDAAHSSATQALALYRGELLAEDGPLEWIVTQRVWLSAQREAMAAIVADRCVQSGQYKDAIDVCEATILERPYADELWRILIQANKQRGDLAAAGKAQLRYDKVLADLNV